MKTTLYLVRQGATDAGTPRLVRLRQRGPSAARDGVGLRQAQLTRDFLAVRALDACYTSPAPRAVETARIIAEPHGLAPCILDGLDDGNGRAANANANANAGPAVHHLEEERLRHALRFPPAETYAQTQDRVVGAIDAVLRHHEGHGVLVVAHRRIHLVYLAHLLDMTAAQAEQVCLDECGVSVVVRMGARTTLATLNASFHLQGVAA